MKKIFKSNKKYSYQEEKLFINPKKYKIKNNKGNKTKFIRAFCKSIIILLIILLIYFFIKNIIFIKTKIENIINTKLEKDLNLSKYKNILPHLTPDLNDIPFSIKQIFNARQIYISDAKITPDYIKYIRPINETEEEKYKKPYSKNKTIIDKDIYKKRVDQYNYVEFCKLALEEKLIDNKTIEYDNKPFISIIIPSYNKGDVLLKSIRSIQNQNFKNIEIIIVNDCSTDNSTFLFNYLLKTEPRIRIFHHKTNMGAWRSRIDGVLYSRGKYIIFFDAGDLYEDNYVLLDAYNVIEKYNLDSCKFLFRIIRSFNTLQNSVVYFHVGKNASIAYTPYHIYYLNYKVFNFWGNIWNRLVRANIYTKALLLLNELILNIHKNVWEDVWQNDIINKASYSYAIFERVGYVYLQDGNGEGSPKSITPEQKSKKVKEYVGFLYLDYNFGRNKTKANIIKKLKEYNETHETLRLQNFRGHFEVLNNLLEALIKDPDISLDNRTYCQKLLDESKLREKEVNQS